MAVVTRTKRPTCDGCAHPISFHGVDFDRCQALGCKCSGYTGDTYKALETMSPSQVAERLGVTEKWVLDHKKDLGGVSMPYQDLYVQRHANGKVDRTGGSVLRFDLVAVEQYAKKMVVADSKDA